MPRSDYKPCESLNGRGGVHAKNHADCGVLERGGVAQGGGSAEGVFNDPGEIHFLLRGSRSRLFCFLTSTHRSEMRSS